MKHLIALLTVATGLLHLLVGFNVIGPGVGGTNWLLVLNGIGYLVLLVLFWKASGNGGTIRWILLAYTLITFFAYFALNSAANFGLSNTIGIITKAIELLLIILLFLYRGSGKQTAKATPAAATAPATRAQTSIDTTRASQPVIDTTVTGAATTASTGAASVGAGVAAAAVTVADRAAETVDEAVEETGEVAGEVVAAADEGVDYVGEKAEAAYDAATDVADDAAEAVEDVVDETAGGAEDAAELIEDKAEGAHDTVADTAADAGDAVSVAVRSGEAVVAGAVAEAVGKDGDDDVDDTDVEGSLEELAEYLRSFGRSSEFTKEIEYVEGIGAVYGQKLRTAGIGTISDLILNGYTRRGRKHISDVTGIAQSLILTWVNHVDLYRIKGVAQEYADLLEQSGVDTVMELAQRNPANLHKRMLEVNEKKSLVRRPPHASEVQSWVEQAKSLRRLIYY